MGGLGLTYRWAKVKQPMPGRAEEVSEEAKEKVSSLGIFRNHLGRLQTVSGKEIGD